MSTSYGGTPPGITGTHYGGADIGIPAELIPADGVDGPGYPYAGLSFPADTGKLIRAPITRWPAGTLVVEEDGAFTYSGANDYALYQLYVDGAASGADIGYGAGIGRFDLGVLLGTLTGGVVLDPAVAAGALGGGNASGISGNVPLDVIDVGGAIAGGSASQVGGAVQLDPADAAGSMSGGSASQLGGGVVVGDVAAAGVVAGVALPVALAGYTVEARPRRASKPKALDVKDPDESIYVLFDFRLIAASVAGAEVRITRFSGMPNDDPAAIASGPLLVDGPRVFRRLDGGVDGCTYHLECQVDADDGSRYVLAALLPVRSV